VGCLINPSGPRPYISGIYIQDAFSTAVFALAISYFIKHYAWNMPTVTARLLEFGSLTAGLKQNDSSTKA